MIMSENTPATGATAAAATPVVKPPTPTMALVLKATEAAPKPGAPTVVIGRPPKPPVLWWVTSAAMIALGARKRGLLFWMGLGSLGLTIAQQLGKVDLISKGQAGAVAAARKMGADFLEGVILRLARKQPVAASDRETAARVAETLKMPLTARAVRSESGLPKVELWPGTGKSVASYIGERLK